MEKEKLSKLHGVLLGDASLKSNKHKTKYSFTIL
jgi:hypothetical protein